MSQYFLGSVSRQIIIIFFIYFFFIYRKSIKIIKNIQKNGRKFLRCLKTIWSRPQKSRVGRVSGNETFFFWPYNIYIFIAIACNETSIFVAVYFSMKIIYQSSDFALYLEDHSVTHISWSSDFALCLEDHLMYEHRSL